LIALADGIADGIAARGVSTKSITVISNGCDLDIFEDGSEAKRPPGVDAADLLVIYAGTHGIANGLDAVLDGAAELKRRDRKDIKLVMVGSGRCKRDLIARATSENLDNVLFLDPLRKNELAQLMRSADIGMQILDNIPAFYRGTSPNKFFDYIAAGLPVLNNYPGWLADMIEDSKCGFAIAPGDPTSFADVLERASADRASLKRMGTAARALAESRFDRRHLAKQFSRCLTGVERSSN
jgi:glycosyltransferase involved in cell wall biosynthesis